MTPKTDNTEAEAFRKCLIVIGILMLLVTIVLVSTLVNAAKKVIQHTRTTAQSYHP